MNIYEGNNIFSPVFAVKKPKHWNKILFALGTFLAGKKFINIFQAKKLNDSLTSEDKL